MHCRKCGKELGISEITGLHIDFLICHWGYLMLNKKKDLEDFIKFDAGTDGDSIISVFLLTDEATGNKFSSVESITLELTCPNCRAKNTITIPGSEIENCLKKMREQGKEKITWGDCLEHIIRHVD